MLSKETLQTCWNNNKDGAGYMFAKNNQVMIKKGFLTFDAFYNSLIEDYEANNLKNNNVVMHFRIGTSGGINKEKTHPFPVTNNVDELNKLKTTCKVGVVHNGILSDYVYDATQFSDTQNFIRDFIHPLIRLARFNLNNDYFKTITTKELKYNKIILLKNDDSVVMLGDFIEDDGYYYSNNTYKEYKLSSFNWSDYEADDYDWRTYNNYYEEADRYYNQKTLPFDEMIEENMEEYDALKKTCCDITGSSIEFDDGFELDTTKYYEDFEYYIDDDGNVYEVNINDYYCSFIGTAAHVTAA